MLCMEMFCLIPTETKTAKLEGSAADDEMQWRLDRLNLTPPALSGISARYLRLHVLLIQSFQENQKISLTQMVSFSWYASAHQKFY